jgi:hypothetical protein
MKMVSDTFAAQFEKVSDTIIKWFLLTMGPKRVFE